MKSAKFELNNQRMPYLSASRSVRIGLSRPRTAMTCCGTDAERDATGRGGSRKNSPDPSKRRTAANPRDRKT